MRIYLSKKPVLHYLSAGSGVEPISASPGGRNCRGGKSIFNLSHVEPNLYLQVDVFIDDSYEETWTDALFN